MRVNLNCWNTAGRFTQLQERPLFSHTTGSADTRQSAGRQSQNEVPQTLQWPGGSSRMGETDVEEQQQRDKLQGALTAP